MRTQLQSLFEELSKSTWERIEASQQVHSPFNEESITELNLLELKRANLPNIKIKATGKGDESDFGIDWEWWIGSNKRGWWRYAVQAKRLFPSGKYDTLRYFVQKKKRDIVLSKKLQFEILENFASKNRAIPLYCFYNFTNLVNLNYWHCKYNNYDKLQLGCTVAPTDVVRNLIKPYNTRSFHNIHISKYVLPWRCLVSCPDFLTSYSKHQNPLSLGNFHNINTFSALPDYLNTDEDIIELDQLRNSSAIYTENVATVPRRFMIANLDNN